MHPRLSQLTRHRRLDTRGFSLVEVLVVLAIVAGLLGVATGAITSLSANDLKSSAMGVSASLKYTYNQAGMNNTHYRVVFDLDEGQYYSEIVRAAHLTAAPPDEQDEEYLTEEARELERKKREKESLFDKDEDNPFGVNRKVSYERVQDALIKPKPLKPGVRIARVYTAGGEVIEDGLAVINYYPTGWQDPVVIHFEDDDGDVFSLITEPLTGRIKLRSEEYIPDDDFGLGEDDD